MAGAQSELRIALLGPVGSGKSTAVNRILGRDWFTVKFLPRAVTQACERKKTEINGKSILVIDTPGLFGPSQKTEINEMENCAKMSAPGLHAFLLVIKLGMRFTEEENLMKRIRDYFGEDATCYTIVLFTHTDCLNGEPLEDYIMESPDLQALIDTCEGRYLSFNNMERDNINQVTELLRVIDNMVEFNMGHHPTTSMFNRLWTFNMTGAAIGAGVLGILVIVGAQMMKQQDWKSGFVYMSTEI